MYVAKQKVIKNSIFTSIKNINNKIVELSQRIKGLVGLGKYLSHVHPDDLEELIHSIRGRNSWFDKENILYSIEGLKTLLNKESIERFVSNYELELADNKTIGIVMAGNLPAVGFHDLLLVLLTGSKAVVKLSQQDEVLMRFLIKSLIEIEPSFSIEIIEKLSLDDLDGVIATGSDNTSRYFESYFNRIPNIIRKNRTSVAVLTGEESSGEFVDLGKDVFQYYGLGCRNVSKIYVPKGFDFPKMLDEFKAFERVTLEHKYDNNYTYHKSVYLINGRKHLDTGFLMITEDESLHSPLSVLYYEFYDTLDHIFESLTNIEDKLQCIATNVPNTLSNSVKLGQTQNPRINDFADGVDVVKFIKGI